MGTVRFPLVFINTENRKYITNYNNINFCLEKSVMPNSINFYTDGDNIWYVVDTDGYNSVPFKDGLLRIVL